MNAPIAFAVFVGCVPLLNAPIPFAVFVGCVPLVNAPTGINHGIIGAINRRSHPFLPYVLIVKSLSWSHR